MNLTYELEFSIYSSAALTSNTIMKKIHRRQLRRGRAIRHCVEQSALQSLQPIIIISIFTLVCLGN